MCAGTLGVAKAVAAVKGTTIIGGGDSVSAVNKAGVAARAPAEAGLTKVFLDYDQKALDDQYEQRVWVPHAEEIIRAKLARSTFERMISSKCRLR